MFTSKVMTRRDFLRVSAVAALGSAVAACAPAAAPAAPAQGEAAAGEAPAAQPGELSGTIVLISFWDISTVSGWDGFYK